MRRVIVVVSVVLLTFGFGGPTLAASKVLDVRMHSFDVTQPPFADSLCGMTTVFQSTWSFGSYSVVAWDNGQFRVRFNFQDKIVDTATGKVIARSNVTHRESFGPGGLPESGSHHVTARCTPDSGDPGHVVTISFGFTVNESGQLTHFHEKITEH